MLAPNRTNCRPSVYAGFTRSLFPTIISTNRSLVSLGDFRPVEFGSDLGTN